MSNQQQYQTLKKLLDHNEFLENFQWKTRQFDANQTVIVEGESHQQIFVVLKGCLMVSGDIEIANGKQRISPGLYKLKEGEEFGHFCFFDNHPHCATVKTITSCQLAIVDVEKLKLFFEKHPDIGYMIVQSWMAALLPRLREGNKRIVNLLSWGLKAHNIDKELA